MIERRHFLRISLLGMLAAAACRCKLRAPTGVGPVGLSAQGFRAATAVGRRYLLTHPGERDFDDVVALLRAGSPRDPLSAVRRRVAEDFNRGRVIVVDGWVLARTEARLCGLLARGA